MNKNHTAKTGITRKLRRRILSAVLLMLLMLAAAFPAAAAGESESTLTTQDFAGQKIGSLTGSPTGQMLTDYFEEDVTVVYFSSDSDMALALDGNKVSAYIADLVTARRMCATHSDHTVITPDIKDNDVGFIFNKDNPESIELCEKMHDFIERCRTDGTLKEIDEKWMGLDVSDKTIDIELTGENGTLVWACSTSVGQPWCFLKDGKYVGYEVELATRFCQENGYALEFMDFDIGGMINAVVLGKCDFGGTGTCITPERKESVLFSDVNYTNRFVLIAKTGTVIETKSGIFQSIANSFERTFIREARWKLFVSGIARTLVITVCSVILGTLLGFAVYLLCRTGNRFANLLTRFMTWLINGLPTVVLLMILFYVVFGKSDINGLWVSVVAFTLVFAAAFQAMLRSGVGAVDYGQTEAAYALSYSDRETFFKIILPQAIPHFLPAYKAQIVSLLKATSIVGYITVQDLTKVGEIVRANTYEAFFPLIAVAIVYFVLAGILIAIVNAVTVNTDKRRRTPDDILKGVNQHD